MVLADELASFLLLKHSTTHLTFKIFFSDEKV
jgi:hypothetical protein